MKLNYDPVKMRNRLRSVADAHPDSYRQISIASGNSESYLSGVLNQGRDPRIAKLLAVCNHLDISLAWAMYGLEIPDGADEIFELLAARPDLVPSVATLLRAQHSDAE